jgi:hypothetical protein
MSEGELGSIVPSTTIPAQQSVVSVKAALSGFVSYLAVINVRNYSVVSLLRSGQWQCGYLGHKWLDEEYRH